MTAFVRTNLFETNTTLESHLVHLIHAYKATVGGQRYAERSDTDSQPYCLLNDGFVAQGVATTNRFLVCRMGIPLNQNGAILTQPIWEQALEFPNPQTLPSGYKATS